MKKNIISFVKNKSKMNYDLDLLKEMYIDSALKQAEKLDKKAKKKPPRKEKKISWDQFKKMNVESSSTL